ncbi:MAG: HD domain-containing phosphohydrolase [Desulfuromonadales bacterium]
MKPLKNILFVNEFNSNLKLINSIITCIVIVFALILAKFCVYTFRENMGGAIKITVIIASIILVCCLLAFKRFSARALSKIAEHAGRYNILLAATRDLRAEQNAEVLCQKILDYAISMTGADAGVIMLMENGILSAKVFRGAISGTNVISMNQSVISTECITNAMCKRNRDEKPGNSSPCEIVGMTGKNISSVMCYPLKGNSDTSGVIRLLHSAPGRFNPDDEEVLEYFSSQAAISLENARFISDHDNFEQHMTELLLLAMDNHLTIKVEHARRVARYCEIIAVATGMSPKRRNVLRSASLLHDVGFVKFLPSDEMKPEVYLKHVTVGHALLSQINLYQEEARFVLHHHERFDGQGYPSRLAGEEIPLESRIIAISEAFDAITSKDSYRKTLGFSEALAEMGNNSGTQFDPVLLDAFINNVGEIL